MHHQIKLNDLSIIGSSGLPAGFEALDADALADLSWVGEPLHAAYAGTGFWPELSRPAGADEVDAALTVDPTTRVVWRAVAAAPAAVLSAPSNVVTPLEFRRLWTFGERVKLDHPELVAGLDALQQAQLGTLLRDLSAASEIRLDHPDVVAGVEMVKAFGIISAERAAAILAGRLPA